MNKKTGILLDSDGDLVVQNGKLILGNTLYQNQYLILKSQKGDIKEDLLLGAGIEDMVNDEDSLSWKRIIREEFARDGLKVSSINLADSELLIKADYL